MLIEKTENIFLTKREHNAIAIAIKVISRGNSALKVTDAEMKTLPSLLQKWVDEYPNGYTAEQYQALNRHFEEMERIHQEMLAGKG